MKKHSWTKKQVKSASVPNYGKKYVVEPALLSLLRNVKGKKVLELGSGNGYWLELLQKKGARCTGIEINQNQIDLAKKKDVSGKIKYIQGDITNLSKLSNNRFDIVFLEHVLLEITSPKALKKIFETVSKVLKKSGRLVISDLHPFAPSSKPKNIRTLSTYNYFSSGEMIKIVSKRLDGKEILYNDVHWTLEDLIGAITRSGLRITDIIEPKPSFQLAKKYPDTAYRLTIPMSIMIRATKV